ARMTRAEGWGGPLNQEFENLCTPQAQIEPERYKPADGNQSTQTSRNSRGKYSRCGLGAKGQSGIVLRSAAKRREGRKGRSRQSNPHSPFPSKLAKIALQHRQNAVKLCFKNLPRGTTKFYAFSPSSSCCPPS